MKLNARTKKILLVLCLVLAAVILTGCAVPRDDNGQTILIWNEYVEGYTIRTSFKEVMQENWFNAIFVYPLSVLINTLAPRIGVGAAIAVVTILVNGVLAIVTIKSSIASQQMQLLQPELERIQRKYEGRDDDTSKMRQANEMQALYRKYDVNPASVILVTFLQLPIIMAMYMAVHRSYAVATGTFCGMDLQQTPLTGFKALLAGDTSQIGYIILFIVMGVCQVLAMKLPQYLQKKKAEEQKSYKNNASKKPEQGKFMQYYMMIMILFFGLMWPAAMSLYWAINSCVNIAKTLIVQKIIDNRNAKKEGARA